MGDEYIEIVDGTAHVRGRDNVIAGSVNCLDENFRALGRYSSLSIGEGAACCGRNAARSIGRNDLGELRPGRRADFVVFNADNQVQMTVVKGNIVYRAE